MIQKNALLCCKLIHQESDELQDTRNLRDEDLRTLAHVILLRKTNNSKKKILYFLLLSYLGNIPKTTG